MRGLTKTTTATMAVTAVVAAFLLATLPPAPVELPSQGLDPDLVRRTVRGAYHVHTTRSDGASDRPSVAAAAQRAGLQFVLFTDHGDATRPPDPPEYLHGVLCLDGVEISTTGGHYVAIGMGASPYPLGGEAASVVEDVRRLGGFGIAAHPHHPKGQLSWSDWQAPVDGLEWINLDAEWRNESSGRLARVLFDYLLRPGQAVASVLDRPVATLARWEELLRERPVVGLAASDAHGGSRRRGTVEGEPGYAIGPSYEASFRALSNVVRLEAPLAGDPRRDATRLLAAIRKGSVYTVIDAVATGVVLGPAPAGQPFRFLSPPADTLVRDPTSHADARWMEAHHPRAPGQPPVPWVLANVVSEPQPVRAEEHPQVAGAPLVTASDWRVEHAPGSSGALAVAGESFTLRYSLRGGERASQYVAAAVDVASLAPFDAIGFHGRGAHPMRVSVQLRFPQQDARWTKSVYLDGTERAVIVRTREMVAADPGAALMPEPATARSLLFVVDLTNALPGSSGAFTISGVRVSARSPSGPR